MSMILRVAAGAKDFRLETGGGYKLGYFPTQAKAEAKAESVSKRDGITVHVIETAKNSAVSTFSKGTKL